MNQFQIALQPKKPTLINEEYKRKKSNEEEGLHDQRVFMSKSCSHILQNSEGHSPDLLQLSGLTLFSPSCIKPARKQATATNGLQHCQGEREYNRSWQITWNFKNQSKCVARRQKIFQQLNKSQSKCQMDKLITQLT